LFRRHGCRLQYKRVLVCLEECFRTHIFALLFDFISDFVAIFFAKNLPVQPIANVIIKWFLDWFHFYWLLLCAGYRSQKFQKLLKCYCVSCSLTFFAVIFLHCARR
jgi:hypothetical protein